jgi:fructosamine-3-kinase
MVVKASERAPARMFVAEAEGLDAIQPASSLVTPKVLHAGPSHLVLEALCPPRDEPAFWEEAGRAVATLHANRGPAHGWPQDNWLGLLAQQNAWSQDGHEFFAQSRVRRYLAEPRLQTALDSRACAAIEKICSRLADLVPEMPAVLCHGDMWRGNLLATQAGRPAVIDPAICYAWAEVDISMMYCTGPPPPERFFDAYHEAHPAEHSWRERMELLNIRELLSTVATFGDDPVCDKALTRVHALIAAYS